MLNKIPDIFNKNFVIGYFLPAMGFTVATLVLLRYMGVDSFLTNSGEQLDFLLGTTIVGLIAWVGGVILSAINRDIIRFVEGYGKYNPLRILKGIEKSRYAHMRNTLIRLENEYHEYKAKGEEFPDDERIQQLQIDNKKQRKRVLLLLATRFPDEDLLLPTAFGNIIRAFEVYPRIMYGLGAIDGWHRILGIVPKAYKQLIDDAKSLMDMWLNLSFLTVLFFIESIVLSIQSQTTNAVPWYVYLFVAGIFLLSFYRLHSAARVWGRWVKAAFDLYIDDLWDKLSFENSVDEYETWYEFSQATLYRDPKLMPLRKLSSKPDKPG